MNKITLVVNKYGTKKWVLNNKTHREDGPAIEYTNGDKFWHINGLLHREDGPAVEFSDGTKDWFLNGELVSELSGQPCNTQEQFEALMRTRAFW